MKITHFFITRHQRRFKKTGFVVNTFDTPKQIEAYDSYDIEINYLFDEGAYASITLVNEQTGDEVINISDLWLSSRKDNSATTITINNDPTDGHYHWRLDILASRNDDSTVVHSQTSPHHLSV